MPLYPKQRTDTQTNSRINRDRTQRYSYDPSYGQTPKDSYEDLFKQFERLQVKAENLAERDPVFASRLENLAKQFASSRKSKHQKSYTNLNSSTTNHTHYSHQPGTVPKQQHQHQPQQQQQPPPPSYNPFHPPNYYRGHVPTPPPTQKQAPTTTHQQQQQPPHSTPPPPQFFANSQSFHNFNNNGSSNPKTNFKNGYNHHRHNHPHRHKRYFANQPDVLFVMEDAYNPNKITVQMTRIQMGQNGEQQRVIIERDFNSEQELNVFLAEFEENITKVAEKEKEKEQLKKETEHNNFKSPGVIVVEEPGEEPKLYRQDTGELVTDSEGFLRGSLYNDIKKSHEKRKNQNESQENTKKTEESHEHRNTYHHHRQEKFTSKNDDYQKKNSKSHNKQQHYDSDSSIKEPTSKKTSKNDEYRRSRTKKSFSSENEDEFRKKNHKSRDKHYKENRSSSSESEKRNSQRKVTTEESSKTKSTSTASNTNSEPTDLPKDSGLKYKNYPRFKISNMTKSNPNIFSNHQTQKSTPPPVHRHQQQQQQAPEHNHNQQSHPQFIPTVHHFNSNPPPVYNQRVPAYGKINLLRYGYSSNQKPRSESRLFEGDTDMQQQSQKIYHHHHQQQQQHQHQHLLYQQHQQYNNINEAFNSKIQKKKKYKIPSMERKHSIYSQNHLNHARRGLASTSKFMHTTEIKKDNSRLISVSISSTKFPNLNRFPIKPKGVTKIYKEHTRFHFDTLRGCKNAANVLKPDLHKVNEKRNIPYLKKEHQPPIIKTGFDYINNNNKYVKLDEATYLCPTYFQPGFYPTNSFPDLNNSNTQYKTNI